MIVSQLQSLPLAPPPATEDVVAAVNQVNTPLTIQKGVLDIINASTSATTAQVTTANALQTAANSLVTSTNSLITIGNSQTVAINSVASGVDLTKTAVAA